MFTKDYRSYFKIASHGRVFLCVGSVVTALCASLCAAPTGGVVVNGAADINIQGSTTDVTQHSNKASINWQGFSISSGEVVNFNQPNQNSLILNRVVGDEKSVIDGALNANGKVFLINSNGILFTKGSSVNTAGLIASALKLSDEDFNADNFIFKADPNGKNSVINLGSIQVKDEGYVSLLGESVINDGVIVANQGTVSLNSGDKITLNFNGNSLINVSIDEGALNSLVQSGNAIIADGGVVILTAKGADELLSSQVNIEGLVQARTIDDLTGNVNINALGGETAINANIDVSAQKGDGGFVETSGDRVSIADTAAINAKSEEGKTGTWLIDPKDFTVGVDISGDTLSAQLENANVEIQSQKGSVEGKGDINVNEKVEWDAGTTLTLTAENDININNAIISRGNDAGVTLNYKGDYHILTPASYSGTVLDAKGVPIAKKDDSGGRYGSVSFYGGNAKFTLNGQEYTLIYSLDELDALDGYNALTKAGTSADVNGYYALAHNLDASAKTYLDSLISLSDTPWSSGYAGTSFSGVFAGLGHTIDKLTISSDKIFTGLFASVGAGSVIRDLGLTNANVATSGGVAGTLVGVNAGDIGGVYVTGKVKAAYSVGGLVGSNSGTSVYSNVFANIEAGDTAGGLIGEARGDSVTIKNSHATGKVSGGGSGGFIAGAYASTTIYDSYASVEILNGGGGLIGSTRSAVDIKNTFTTGSVTGGGGGLIGDAGTGDTNIKNVYTTGDVRGGGGGLVGNFGNALQGIMGTIVIQDTFTTGNVYGEGALGGLIGNINSAGTYIIDNVYTTGNVISTGSSTGHYVGGLIGGSYVGVTITNSYATGNVVGGIRTGGLVGFATGGSISNSWSSGNVNGFVNTGGIAGEFGGAIIDSRVKGTVVGGGSVGGIVGVGNGATITNGYYDADKNPTAGVDGSGKAVVNGGGGLSGEEAAFIDIVAQDADLASRFIAGRTTASVASTAIQRDNTERNSVQLDRDEAYAYAADVESVMGNVTMANSYSSDIGAINIEGQTYILNEEGE